MSPFGSSKAQDASTVPAVGSIASERPGPVGIVLAGGASRRFGRDKATLEIARSREGGEGETGVETLAEWALRRLAEVCGEVAVADGGRGLLAGISTLADGPGRGPAAGLLGAARAFPARALLVLACDLPAVSARLLAKIAAIAAGGDFDLVLPRWEGGAEPLAALYGPKALAALDRRVAAGNFALYDLAERPGMNVATLSAADLLPFGPPEEIFANVNTPEDLARWLARSERG